ncbi:MAG TPA: hypothetical protein VFS15_08355 [Kofleriaceae bacterium]|nr:hypothetical protein [Kofleriaceae bacterium]
MIERVALVASPLRIACAALAIWIGMRVDLFAPANPVPRAVDTMRISDACAHAVRDDTTPRTQIRTRTPGLHHRFLTRDVVAPRALRQYQQ